MGVKKIILIAGHGGSDPGARGVIMEDHRLYEADVARIARDCIYHYLMISQHDDPSIKYKVYKDDDTLTLRGVINWLNNVVERKEDRIILDIHLDAFNGKATGSTTFVPDVSTEIERKLAEKIVHTTARILGITKRGVKKESSSQHKRLAIMRPMGINVLWEIAFIDNQQDMEKLFKHFSILCSQIAKNLQDTVKELS